MRIGIFSSVLNAARTGIGNYTSHLISGLASYAPSDTVVLINDRHTDGFSNPEIVIRNPLPLFRTYGWYPYATLRIRSHPGVDVIHNPYQVPTWFSPGHPYVITIHDLTPILFPDEHPRGVPAFFRLLLPRTLRDAGMIIADSGSTKSDLMHTLHIPEEKIRVVYPGVDSRFRPADDCGIREKLRLEGPFILTVGTIEPRKNLVGLLNAYRELRDGGIRHRLVVAGGLGWRYDRIFPTVRSLGLEDSVTFTGYVDSADLPALYSAADVFAYPSLYEGFGFPPLEAMACGCPVVTSDVSSLPEVAGDAAILVNPRDSSAIAAGIRELLGDESLRADMSRKGREQALRFSWERCVRETAAVYREVAR